MYKKYEDFEREASQYRQILIDYRDKGTIFTDPNFPSYYSRVDQAYPAPLFKEELIKPEYIKQGEVGNCYLISAFVQMSTQPYLVKYLFDHQADEILGKVPDSINLKSGAVVIYFHAFGRKTPVLIDTTISYSKSQLVDDTKSAWFILVEKAYAKLYGSYEQITSGTLMQSIYALYGYCEPLYDMKSRKKGSCKSVFEDLMKFKNEDNAIMGASIIVYVNGEVTFDELKRVGLVAYHSYLILNLKTYNGKNFLQLRNPWAGHEWRGDYSDDSELWTTEMKREFGLVEKNDGIFWMTEEDFERYFEQLEVIRPMVDDMKHKKHVKYTIPRSSGEVDLEKLPVICQQHTEKLDGNDPVYTYIHVERRRNKEDDNGKVIKNDDILPICNPINFSKDYKMKCWFKMNTFSTVGLIYNTEDVNDFIFHHGSYSCNYQEDLYLTFYSSVDFKLYYKDKPSELIPDDDLSDPFDNFSTLERNESDINIDQKDDKKDEEVSKHPMSQTKSKMIINKGGIINDDLILEINIIEATVPKMDVFHWCDPYVVVKNLETDEITRTEIINDTKNPNWNHKFDFHLNIFDYFHEVLSFNMIDYDKITRDDFISKIDIPLKTIPISTLIDKWYDMNPGPKALGNGGKLRISLYLKMAQKP